MNSEVLGGELWRRRGWCQGWLEPAGGQTGELCDGEGSSFDNTVIGVGHVEDMVIPDLDVLVDLVADVGVATCETRDQLERNGGPVELDADPGLAADNDTVMAPTLVCGRSASMPVAKPRDLLERVMERYLAAVA